MTALLKKNFKDFPDWWPEMDRIIAHGNVFEETRKMKKLSPSPPISGGPEGYQLVIQVYNGNAFELPASIAEHSATAIWLYKASTREWWLWSTYPNHGRDIFGEGMYTSQTCYGVVAPPPSNFQVECQTSYGITTGSHVCNDDTMVQIFYVKHGYAADLYGYCCGDNILNRYCPVCYDCCN
jgi:hypothetical protein